MTKKQEIKKERIELIKKINKYDKFKNKKLIIAIRHSIKPYMLEVISDELTLFDVEEFEEMYRELAIKKTESGKEKEGIEETSKKIIKKAKKSGISDKTITDIVKKYKIL